MKSIFYTIFVIFLISIFYVSATSHDGSGHPCGTNHDDDCDPNNFVWDDYCDDHPDDGIDDGLDDHDDGECNDLIPQDYCGDGVCTDTEKYANDPCPADCCGDGYCSPYEDQYCPGDCNDVGSGPVTEGYPPCDPGDIAVCHSDCSCRCESPSYSGPNYASDCPNAPEESPAEVTPYPDEYDVGITSVIAPYPDLDFLESVIFDFEITNWNAPTSANWDVELYNANGLLVGTKNGDTSTLSLFQELN